MTFWGQSKTRRKQDGSLVTDADQACEDLIVCELTKAFPGCAIISEEGTETHGEHGTWYVDPIDGTSSFVEGLAHWGPTISLVVGQDITLGAFWQPRLNEFWFASTQSGAYRNSERLQLTNPAQILSYHPFYGPSGLHHYLPIPWPGKLRALGATAAHLAMAASMEGAAAFVPRWKFWDIGNGILMVEQSGGVITDLAGRSWHPLRDAKKPFLAGSPRAIEHLLQNGPLLNDV